MYKPYKPLYSLKFGVKMEKNQMSKHIHALGMKLQERVSSKVVYKVILVTHLEAIV